MEVHNLSLKPIQLSFVGTGSPGGNDPRGKAERMLSMNLVYLCKTEAKTAKELSDALGVPMPYIEEELDIQCRGGNGSYGLLRKLENGKYISNILIVDEDEYEAANVLYEKHLEDFCACLRKAVEKSREKLLAFPFLSRQEDPAFILWSLLSPTVWNLQAAVSKIISETYFPAVEPVKRDFTTVAVAVKENNVLFQGFYGCDGVTACDLCGYSCVFFSNIYGARMDKHFSCDHNLSMDSQIRLTLRSIGGLDVSSLSDADQEIAAKAMECGYLRKNGTLLEPKILVFREEDRPAFDHLLSGFTADSQKIAEAIAGDMATFMKKHIPKHLMNEYPYYNSLIASIRLLYDTVEACIRDGLLLAPDSRLCAEGTFMTVKK